MYGIHLKSGYVDTDSRGRITYDSRRNYSCEPHDGWLILGISTRHNSNCIVSLERAANGESIGQGWIHDLDHGTHRIWGMPKTDRAVRVERL